MENMIFSAQLPQQRSLCLEMGISSNALIMNPSRITVLDQLSPAQWISCTIQLCDNIHMSTKENDNVLQMFVIQDHCTVHCPITP